MSIFKISQIYKAFILLFIPIASFYFGYEGKATEMGIIIVSGTISLAFVNIDKIKLFKGAGFEAQMHEQQEQLNTIIAKESEPIETSQSMFQIKAYGTDETTKSVIKALGNPSYTWRYIGGISEESGLSKNTVKKPLEWLVINGLATQTKGNSGMLWGLSAEGLELLRNIQASE